MRRPGKGRPEPLTDVRFSIAILALALLGLALGFVLGRLESGKPLALIVTGVFVSAGVLLLLRRAPRRFVERRRTGG
jgi:F0F1-type ATP synthase assembly protein I